MNVFLYVYIFCIFCTVNCTWEATTLPTYRWTAVAVSSDGQRQYAVSDSDGVYFSNSSGASWAPQTQLPVENDYEAVAVSDNASVVLIAGYNRGLYLSHNGGESFAMINTNPKALSWYSVAVSSDGQIMYAATFNESLYWSIDYGNTFSVRPIGDYNGGYFGIACDASGQYVVAALTANAPVIFSNDSGNSWYYSPSTNTFAVYRGVAISRDGSVMVALASFSGIYVSRNYGETWSFSRQNVALLYAACDFSCQSIVVGTFNSFLIQSFNQGGSWLTNRAPGRRNWFGVASDASGQYALAAVYTGNVFSGDLFPPPTASPTIAPTARPTISYSPSRFPTFSPTIRSQQNAVGSENSSATRIVQLITIIVICVLGGGSCVIIMCFRICSSRGDANICQLIYRLFTNPYLLISGNGRYAEDARDNGSIVVANIEIVPTADTVQVIGDIEEDTAEIMPVDASVKFKGAFVGKNRRRSEASINEQQVAVVATAVNPSPSAAIAIRTLSI